VRDEGPGVMPEKNSYPPLDTPKPVADGVWVVDDRPLHPLGAPIPIRMTVVRLANGDLLLHSPCRYSPVLAAELERLGPIRHLVAPSFGHWMFVTGWRRARPRAVTWAAPGLRRRRQVRAAGLRIDHDLTDEPPAVWAGELDQVVLRAGPFAEVAFYHRASRALLLTDLVLNLEPERIPVFWRGPLRLLGVTAPAAKAPAYLRALIAANRSEAAAAAARLVAFAPERVIFAHGDWFRDRATERLRSSLGWLLDPGSRRSAAAPAVIVGATALAVVAAGLVAVRAVRRRR